MSPTKRTTQKVKALKVPVYSMEGKKLDSIELSPEVFSVAVKRALISKAVMIQQRNARAAIGHTKTRSERRGGGRKPWRQKGTGRARAGSTRSPIWKKGGITFGPRSERNFGAKINLKEKRQALRGALSMLARQDKGVLVMEALSLKEIKTKTLKNLFDKLSLKRSVLLVMPERNEKVELSARNMARVKTQLAHNLNLQDLLTFHHLVLTRDGLDKVTKTYSSNK